ncbi:MAG TPA: ABC transporter permease [Bacillota bacterium]
MRALASVFTVAWRQTWTSYRHPLSLFWLVVLPLVFGIGVSRLFVFGGAVPTVAVVDLDGTPSAAALIAGLEQTPYEVQRVTREEAQEMVAAGRVPSALIIPEGFDQSVAAGRPRLEVIQGPAMGRDSLVGTAVARAKELAAGRPLTAPAVVNEPPRPSAGEDFERLRVTWGIFAMFIIGTGLQGAASFHGERSGGTLQRMLVLGVPYGVILAGHGLSLVLVGLVQAAIFLLFTGLVGLPWLAAGPAVLAAPVLFIVLAGAGLGMAMAGVTRSVLQVRNLGAALTPALAMLGGGFWPLEVVPAAMQEVARLSPVYWSIEALRQGFVYAGTVAGQSLSLAVLALFAVLGVVVGVHGLRRLTA